MSLFIYNRFEFILYWYLGFCVMYVLWGLCVFIIIFDFKLEFEKDYRRFRYLIIF